MSTRSETPSQQTGARQLPSPSTAMFGRDRDVAAIRDLLLLGPRRLVTLTGPGGVGKTRLALRAAAELAEEFDDNVAFVSLAAERDPEAMPLAILGALRSDPTGGTSADAHALDRLIRAILDRRVLLVLDNLEQLLSGVSVLATLLAACPELRILATSRVRLRLSDEQEFPVAPLLIPVAGASGDEALTTPAVALFIERAGAVRPGFAPGDETAAIVDICRRLDGLPLAIELAAARVAHLRPAALRRAMLESPHASTLLFLSGGARDAPARHQTMRNAITWSVDLLDRRSRATFACLGVFAGGFTLDAAEHVCGRDAGFETIGALIDASLVQMRSEQRDTESRYLMLEPVRETALELLEEGGTADEVRARLAGWLIDLNLRVNEQIRGPDEARWLALLDAEQANIRSILSWCLERGDAETAIRLSTKGVWFLWSTQGTRRDESRWLVRALDLAEEGTADVDPEVLGHGLHSLGMYIHRVGEFARARSLIDRAIIHLRAAGDRTGVAVALGNLANVLTDLDDYAGARRALNDAIAIHRTLGDPKGLIIPLINLSAVAIAAGDMAAATMAIDDADDVVRQVGNERDIAYVDFFRGIVAVHDGRAEDAEELLRVALKRFRELPDTNGIAMTPNYLARALLLRGQVREAAGELVESLPLLVKTANRPYASLTLDTLADALIRIGSTTEGARMLGASTAIRESLHSGARPVDVDKLEALEAAARDAIGLEPFLAAESEGRRMSFEAAMAQAITLAESVAGSRTVDRAPGATPTTPAQPGPLAALTARERDVLDLMSKGMSDREIADSLWISHRTVSHHVGSILAKLDAPSRTAAVAIALRDARS